MGRRLWRLLVAEVAAGVLVAACGGEGGEAFTTTTAGPVGTVGETTTTAAWGEAMAPGVGALVEGSRVLLREDFQDGDTAGWVVEAGWYLLENGERRMAAAGGEAWAWFQDGLGWSRYGARLVLMVNAGSLGVSVAVGEGGRYVVQFSDQGVHLLKDAPFGNLLALGSAQPVEAGVAHVLAVGCDGGHLQVYVDGVLLIDATDPSPLPGGSIGLGAGEGSSVVVDNVVVASLSGPLPQVQAVAEPADSPLPEVLADAAPQAGEQLGEASEPAEPGFPNLVLTAVRVPATVPVGESFNVSMTVANTGDADAGTLTVMLVTEWEEACSEELGSLAAGESTTVTCGMTGLSEEGTFFWRAAPDWWEMIDEGGREADNEVAGTIRIAGEETVEVLPNVAIGWAERLPVDPAPGDAVTIFFGVSQTNPEWGGRLPDLEFRVFYEGGNTACRTTVPSGDAAGACEVPAFGQVGEYPLQLVIDAANALTESNEEDNAVFRSIRVSEPGAGLPNLYLDYFDHSSAALEAGQPFEVVIGLLTEPSDADLSSYTVRMLVDNVVVCSLDTAISFGSFNCEVPGLAEGAHQFAVYIDADNDIAESDEADNDWFGQLSVQG